jgi:hypothetical protein
LAFADITYPDVVTGAAAAGATGTGTGGAGVFTGLFALSAEAIFPFAAGTV